MNNITRSFTSWISLLLIGLILAIAVNLSAPRIARADPGVLYAAPNALGSDDCSAWADACTLQTALSTAVSGEEIWVQEGVHLPGTTLEDTFTLKSSVALYGGFAGTETSRDQRDLETNLTILSGDIVGNHVYHVVTSISTAALPCWMASLSRPGGRKALLGGMRMVEGCTIKTAVRR